ncbi:hypothetical protein DPMN_032636 [Dreissena polymorpha]|uniref:Uncharacterized protein n=1 Tax=Dreissena polymorpha TaxID=45954 RepID=A0A9D4M247_DREPO|nr:hypothetical protein DPMN_032636 [Dreissena polymorpha]
MDQYRPNEGKLCLDDVYPNVCTHIVYVLAKLNGYRLKSLECNNESTDLMCRMYRRRSHNLNVNLNINTHCDNNNNNKYGGICIVKHGREGYNHN